MGAFGTSYGTSFRLATICLVVAVCSVVMVAAQSKPGALAPQYINGVYIPSALLIVGTAIVKRDWITYAAALAVILGAWKVFSSCTFTHSHTILPPLLSPAKLVEILLIVCSRATQGSQARPVPRIHIEREDSLLSQCCHLPIRTAAPYRHPRATYRSAHFTRCNN